MADVVIINKIDTANADDINTVRENIEKANPEAVVIEAASPVFVKEQEQIYKKRINHRRRSHINPRRRAGAGYVAAKKYGAKEIVDAKPSAVEVLLKHIKESTYLLLPARLQ